MQSHLLVALPALKEAQPLFRRTILFVRMTSNVMELTRVDAATTTIAVAPPMRQGIALILSVPHNDQIPRINIHLTKQKT